MAMYTLTWNGDDYEVEADLTQASAPILLDGAPTPYQTADARHRESELLSLLDPWLANESHDDRDPSATLERVENRS